MESQQPRVDILHSTVELVGAGREKIEIYGVAENSNEYVVGFTLSCIVEWNTEDYSLNENDELARGYFENLVRSHVDSHLVAPDASLNMTFTDPELNEPIGSGSGFLKFQSSFQN